MDIETIFKFIQSMNGGSQSDKAQNMFKLLNQQSKDISQNQNTTTQSSSGGAFDFSKIMPLFSSKPDPNKIMQNLVFNMPQFKNMNNLFTSKTSASSQVKTTSIENKEYKSILDYKKIE